MSVLLTLLISSGLIHAVYTPEDYLVFGGNFVIDKQLRVAQIDSGSGAFLVQVSN